MATANASEASAASDVVAVLNADLLQVFETARPIKAAVKEEAKAMDHPLETGATITDHRVILPVEIELSLLLATEEYREVYQQIRALFLSSELLTVQTRTGSYPNMLIVGMPHEESPDMMDAAAVAVKLKEAQFVQPQYAALKVKDPVNASTVQRGEQQPKTSAQEPRKGSILSGVFR